MKFKFCGDADAPDYILAIIHSNLCGLSSIKLKIFASYVVDVTISSIENVFDEQKFMETLNLSAENLKSASECVRFLLLSAVRFGVTKDVFAVELQQLGLPREHSLALGKVLDDKSVVMKNYLREKSLSVNELKSVKIMQSDSGIECLKMELEIDHFRGKNQIATKEINISKSDIPILLKELKIIQNKMRELSYE